MPNSARSAIGAPQVAERAAHQPAARPLERAAAQGHRRSGHDRTLSSAVCHERRQDRYRRARELPRPRQRGGRFAGPGDPPGHRRRPDRPRHARARVPQGQGAAAGRAAAGRPRGGAGRGRAQRAARVVRGRGALRRPGGGRQPRPEPLRPAREGRPADVLLRGRRAARGQAGRLQGRRGPQARARGVRGRRRGRDRPPARVAGVAGDRGARRPRTATTWSSTSWARWTARRSRAATPAASCWSSDPTGSCPGSRSSSWASRRARSAPST